MLCKNDEDASQFQGIGLRCSLNYWVQMLVNFLWGGILVSLVRLEHSRGKPKYVLAFSSDSDPKHWISAVKTTYWVSDSTAYRIGSLQSIAFNILTETSGILTLESDHISVCLQIITDVSNCSLCMANPQYWMDGAVNQTEGWGVLWRAQESWLLRFNGSVHDAVFIFLYKGFFLVKVLSRTPLRWMYLIQSTYIR